MNKELLKQKLWDEGKQIILSAPQLYVDIDIEADGVAGFGSMLAIGAQSPTGESFYSEIKPITKYHLKGHREFCETHNLNRKRLLKEAPNFKLVMTNFYDWSINLISTYNKPLIFSAFGASFDYPFVDLYFKKTGFMENPYGFVPLDLKSLALTLSGEWDFKDTSKGKLPKIIVPDGDFTHHAQEDARFQQKIHFGLAALLFKQHPIS